MASKHSLNIKQKQQEAKEASEMLLQMEHEQTQKQHKLKKLTAELQLTKQRRDDASKVAALQKSRAEAAEQISNPPYNGTVQNFLTNHQPDISTDSKVQPVQKITPIRLKGMDLPNFCGEDKADYESWRAAFMSVVDQPEIPVGKKMLRLENS